MTDFLRPVCRGSKALGTACGQCEKCEKEDHEQYEARLHKQLRADPDNLSADELEELLKMQLMMACQTLRDLHVKDPKRAAARMRLPGNPAVEAWLTTGHEIGNMLEIVEDVEATRK